MANTDDKLYLDGIIQDMKYFDETNYVIGQKKVVLRNIWFWLYCWFGIGIQGDIHQGGWILTQNASCGLTGKKHGHGWGYFIIHGSNVLTVTILYNWCILYIVISVTLDLWPPMFFLYPCVQNKLLIKAVSVFVWVSGKFYHSGVRLLQLTFWWHYWRE